MIILKYQTNIKHVQRLSTIILVVIKLIKVNIVHVAMIDYVLDELF